MKRQCQREGSSTAKLRMKQLRETHRPKYDLQLQTDVEQNSDNSFTIPLRVKQTQTFQYTTLSENQKLIRETDFPCHHLA